MDRPVPWETDHFEEAVEKAERENPYLKRKNANGKNPHGKKAEKHTAKRTGAKRTLASGAVACNRGDLTMGDFQIENKVTHKFSISVTYDWLVKVCQESRQEGKVPAISFQFVDGQGRPRRDGAFVAIPEALFVRLADAGLLDEGSD